MPMASLKGMGLNELIALRDAVEGMLSEKRRDLERQLASLDRGYSAPKNGRVHKLAGSKAPVKYRHPATGESWSGRGRMASWLKAEIKGGKKADHFLVRGQGRPKKK